ncbi:hypothetical protein AB9K26_04335 [Psychroserpens sp. XS_ASV72]|uniref:hypothetical protein n=1 Tax=Psychroserpens sp. XS_ASV72 TaxID=3241293 RepID=UPI00351267D4
MAPIKFEEQLKEKLENRSLQPSDGAWDTLHKRLDEHDGKNKSVRFWWLGIAASIIGVIIVATQFFKSPESKSNMPIIVNSEESIEATNEKFVEESIPKEIIEDDNNNVVVSTPIEEKKKEELIKTSNNSSVVKQQTPIKIIDSEPAVASINEKADVEMPTVPVKELGFEELKVKEVVAEIIEQQKAKGNVTEQEIDSLLKHAQRDILKQRIYDETTKTVNANSLLQDVESELEESFRSKVFEKLQLSFKTVKTAVAERNN